MKSSLPSEIYHALALAKSGWCGGDPGRILGAPAPLVLDMIHFSRFLSDFEETGAELAKEDAR